eukprot:2927091-Rhodomonas_salina.1
MVHPTLRSAMLLRYAGTERGYGASSSIRYAGTAMGYDDTESGYAATAYAGAERGNAATECWY